jgi:hypothetical protein
MFLIASASCPAIRSHVVADFDAWLATVTYHLAVPIVGCVARKYASFISSKSIVVPFVVMTLINKAQKQ